MKNILFLIILTVISVTYFVFPKSIRSAPALNFKDTLSSSQLSYFGRLGSGVSAGDNIVRIALSGNPSNDTNNLFVGDTIGIGTTGAGVGSSGPLTIYSIRDIGNTALFQLNSNVGQSNAFVGAAVVATRSAIHTISFAPQVTSMGGYWEFMIKATGVTGETYNDGIPDSNGFDLGQDVGSTTTGLGTRLKVTDVTCPNWAGLGTTTAYSIGTTNMPISIGDTGNLYNVITCYLGVGVTNLTNGTTYTAIIGRPLASGSQLINPSPHDSIQGSADVYTFYIRQKDSAGAVIDGTTARGKIAVVEAVRVSATVDPTLTFTIDATGVTSGNTVCGNLLGANANNTTATQVAFGSLALSTSNDLAQRLSCTTNADNGYVITVYEDGPMKNISNATTIPDTSCPGGGGCTTSGIGSSWTTFSASGWGYTIQNISVGTSIFTYGNYRAFGNGTTNAQQIMKNTVTPSGTESAYVCYRVTASTTQEAGNYENRLIYTATANF